MQAAGPAPATGSTDDAFAQFIARSLKRPGQSRYFEGAGLRLHYLEWPAGEPDPAAPPLLLLHGFLAHAHWWDFVAPWLAHRRRVIALDFGGMGDSGHREQYTAGGFIAEIEAIAAHENLAGGIAIGHSFGGRTLLHACKAHPGLFSRAIIVDTRLVWPDDPLMAFAREWRPKKRYASEAEILPRFALRPEEPAPREAMTHMARASARRDGDAWVWKFDEQITRLFANAEEGPPDDGAALVGLTTPVELIYGELSQVVTPSRARYFERAVPGCREPVCLPGGYHHLPISQPQPLIAALQALLRDPRD